MFNFFCLYLNKIDRINGYSISFFRWFVSGYRCSTLYRCKTYHLKEHSGLSPFSYKASLLKKIYNRSLYRLLVQTTSWNTGRELISQFIDQANNHRASNIKFTLSRSLGTKILFQDIIVFKGKSVKTCEFSCLGTHFKLAGLFQNTHFSSCHPKVRDKEWHHQRQIQSLGCSSEPIPLKEFSKRHHRWRGYSQKQINETQTNCLCHTLWKQRKGIPTRATEHRPN